MIIGQVPDTAPVKVVSNPTIDDLKPQVQFKDEVPADAPHAKIEIHETDESADGRQSWFYDAVPDTAPVKVVSNPTIDDLKPQVQFKDEVPVENEFITLNVVDESEFGRWNRYEVAPDSTEKIPGQTNATNQENTTLTGETGVLGTDSTVDVPPSNKNVTQSGKAAATKVNPKIKLAVAATSGLAEFNPAYLNEDKNTPSIKNTRKVPKPTSKHVTKSDVSVFGVGLLIALAVATGFTLTRKKWTS